MSLDLFAKKRPQVAQQHAFELGAGWRYGLVLALVIILVGWGYDAWVLASVSAEFF